MSKRKTRFSTFHERVASDSTKGTQGGRVDVLPPRAKQMVLAVLSMEEARQQVTETMAAVQKRLSNCHPDERRDLLCKLGELKDQLSRTKGETIKRAREEVRGYAFYICSLSMMAPDAFKIIDMEAQRLIADTCINRQVKS